MIVLNQLNAKIGVQEGPEYNTIEKLLGKKHKSQDLPWGQVQAIQDIFKKKKLKNLFIF
jgi:hypothetical protein